MKKVSKNVCGYQLTFLTKPEGWGLVHLFWYTKIDKGEKEMWKGQNVAIFAQITYNNIT
jgi:hypothetical protein